MKKYIIKKILIIFLCITQAQTSFANFEFSQITSGKPITQAQSFDEKFTEKLTALKPNNKAFYLKIILAGLGASCLIRSRSEHILINFKSTLMKSSLALSGIGTTALIASMITRMVREKSFLDECALIEQKIKDSCKENAHGISTKILNKIIEEAGKEDINKALSKKALIAKNSLVDIAKKKLIQLSQDPSEDDEPTANFSFKAQYNKPHHIPYFIMQVPGIVSAAILITALGIKASDKWEAAREQREAKIAEQKRKQEEAAKRAAAIARMSPEEREEAEENEKWKALPDHERSQKNRALLLPEHDPRLARCFKVFLNTKPSDEDNETNCCSICDDPMTGKPCVAVSEACMNHSEPTCANCLNGILLASIRPDGFRTPASCPLCRAPIPE